MARRKTEIIATVYGDETLREMARAVAEARRLTITEYLRRVIKEDYEELNQNKS